MRPFFVVLLVPVIAFGALVIRVWPSSIVGPRDVDVEFDERLGFEGAMVVGLNESVELDKSEVGFAGTERREVVVEPLAADGFHVTIDGRGVHQRYRYVVELWVEFDEDGDPLARADFRVASNPPPGFAPVLGLDGDVALGEGLRPRARADAPAVLTYCITGDLGGSPATVAGKLRLR